MARSAQAAPCRQPRQSRLGHDPGRHGSNEPWARAWPGVPNGSLGPFSTLVGIICKVPYTPKAIVKTCMFSFIHIKVKQSSGFVWSSWLQSGYVYMFSHIILVSSFKRELKISFIWSSLAIEQLLKDIPTLNVTAAAAAAPYLLIKVLNVS